MKCTYQLVDLGQDKIRRFLLVILLVFASVSQSQSQSSLSLDQAVSLALKQSLTLQKSALDLAAAGYSEKHLWSEIFPAISAGAGLSYGSTLFTGNGFEFKETNAGYSLNLGLTLSLNTGLPYRMKITRLAYQSRLLEYEDARRQLEIQVSKAFYTLLAARRQLDILQESQSLAEKQREKNRIAFQNGLIPQRDYLQSQLSVETAKLDVSKTQASYASALRDFFTLLGIDTAAVLEGVIEITEIKTDPEALIQTYLVKRPDIIKQRQTIERLEYTERQTTFSSRGPSLSLSTQWRGNGGGDGKFTDNLSGSLTLSIPIDPWIPGTKAAQSIRSAGSEVEKAKLDLQNIETSAKNQIRSVTADLQNSWHTIEISQLRVRIAEQTYQLTEQAFQMGTVEFLTVEDTRTKLGQTQQQLLADELAYKLKMLDLAGALNLSWEEFIGSFL